MKIKSIIVLLVVVVASLFITLGCENEKEKEGKYDYLVLVNKYTQLPDDWEKKVELVDAKNAWDEDIKVEKQAYEQYKKLAADVNKELEKYNATIELDSTYRSVKDQQNLWDEWSEDPEKGPEYVRKYVAVPGYSEHHTGLAIDICLKIDGELVYDNDEMKEQKDIFSVVHSKLADYGFILRYPEGREDSTGYTYEPWHLRYVGSTEVAKDIDIDNLTFEEYLDDIFDISNNHSAAIYRIENTLTDYLKEAYGDKITNVRYNVTKVYTKKEADKDKTLKTLKLTEDDVAFEVTYQIQPADEDDIKELTVTDGEYDEDLGWVTGISRLGVLKYDNKAKGYTIENFGTGW